MQPRVIASAHSSTTAHYRLPAKERKRHSRWLHVACERKGTAAFPPLSQYHHTRSGTSSSISNQDEHEAAPANPPPPAQLAGPKLCLRPLWRVYASAHCGTASTTSRPSATAQLINKGTREVDGSTQAQSQAHNTLLTANSPPGTVSRVGWEYPTA